ncbi:Mob1/phocein [Myriangium duriaei CBS 260.36]|uniref:Mob1/phocein n=1 Tax=Myriangium duriaei CBS 260.36 TaxID=1168546 RepID=A0A9P4MK59_9PEZI|nr:Mob1/phocein [Myriangium duriaei CBS 260.36]
MTSFFSNMRSGFARGNSNKTLQTKPGNGGQSPTGFDHSPSQGSLNQSPMPSPSLTSENPMSSDFGNRRTPYFFREQYANLIVKGNFMTLAAKPVLIEEGEWLAHQVVEQNRLLDGMLKVIQETDRNTGLPICNQHTCPSMTAGPGVTYTWLDANKNSVRVPAPQYIAYVQRWITGKVTDPSNFPTETYTGAPPSLNTQSSFSQSSPTTDNWLGKSSGFPANFPSDIRNIYRQMFRCYAHMYHNHWLEFWHLGAYKELNTCFIHFVNVGRLFGLLTDRDLEPMGPLVDIWLEKGWLPRPTSAGGQMTASSSRGPSRAGSTAADAGAQQSMSQGSLGQGQMGPPGSAGSM